MKWSAAALTVKTPSFGQSRVVPSTSSVIRPCAHWSLGLAGAPSIHAGSCRVSFIMHIYCVVPVDSSKQPALLLACQAEPHGLAALPATGPAI